MIPGDWAVWNIISTVSESCLKVGSPRFSLRPPIIPQRMLMTEVVKTPFKFTTPSDVELEFNSVMKSLISSCIRFSDENAKLLRSSYINRRCSSQSDPSEYKIPGNWNLKFKTVSYANLKLKSRMHSSNSCHVCIFHRKPRLRCQQCSHWPDVIKKRKLIEIEIGFWSEEVS